MEILDVIDYRINIQNYPKMNVIGDEINIKLFSEFLTKNGIVHKQRGLCAEPFDKYFDYTSDKCRLDIRLNYEHSTRKKKTYFSSIDVLNLRGYYYICCLAQTSFFKKHTGVNSIVYKVKEVELIKTLTEILVNVQFNYS